VIAKARTGSTFGGLQQYLLRAEGQELDAGRGLQEYLLSGRSGEEADRVAWTSARNLPVDDPECAALVMQATAEQNPRVQKPVYHLSLSAAPGEQFSRQHWERMADRVLRDIGLHQHQALLVAHRDTTHQHIHLMINRVHPDTLKAWSNSHDYARLERSERHLEREHQLREVPGRHYQLDGQEQPRGDRGPTAGERQAAKRTGEEAWAERVRFQVRNDLKQAQSWPDIEKRLAGHGLRLQKRGPGLVVTDGERQVKASRIHRGSSYQRLAERFGSRFEDWKRDRGALVKAVGRVERVERLRTDLHHRRERFRAEAAKAKSWVSQYRRLNRSAREVSQRLGADLARAYRPEELRTVRRRLAQLAHRGEWGRAVRVLRDEPERLGKLRGSNVMGVKSAERKAAHRASRSAAEQVKSLGVLRPARRRMAGERRGVVRSLKRARARLGAVHRVLQGLPSGKTLQGQLARVAVRVGVKAAELVIPRPAVQVLRAALALAKLAQEATMGRGR